MWNGLENDFGAYADDATLIPFCSSLDMRAAVANFLNCNPAKISAW